MAHHPCLQSGQPVAAAGAASANRQLVLDELTASTGENGRTAGETCPLLLAAVGREPSDAAAVCQYAGEDRWTAASVGIAQAAAPKKTISISLGNGELSEKLVLEAGAMGFQEPWKVGWERGAFEREQCVRRARLEANGGILSVVGRPK